MKRLSCTWWGSVANSYDDDKGRYRLFSFAYGKGRTPLAGSKNYHRYFFTVSFRNKLFRVRKNNIYTWGIPGWYLCIAGIELSFKDVGY